jgi:hypothetical protein
LARLDKASRNLSPPNVLNCPMRMPVIAAVVLALALWAAPAEARLVYVKRASSLTPTIYVASNSGKHPRRLGVGRAPAVSPDGRWVAYITVPRIQGELDEVVVTSAAGGTKRLVMHARTVDSVRFSPDSARVGAILNGHGMRVYDIAADEVVEVTRGQIRGYSFSPDSTRVVIGKATGKALDAPADLYVGRVTGGDLDRITTTKNALNPVWGATSIVFDRQRRRRGDAPAYNLWSVDPAGAQPMRRLTNLKIPSLVSGLVPLELSADSSRLLAVFTGQDTEVGFTVATRTGRTHALSRDFEHGLVGFDLSADGRTILAHTGGPDPSSAHDVVSLPYRGGKPRVLVRDAAYPDWSR